MRLHHCLFFLLLCSQLSYGRQIAVSSLKRIPAVGIELKVADEQELRDGLLALNKDIAQLKLRKDHFTADLLPDVQIYDKAVDYALRYQEFFNLNEVTKAKDLLKEGKSRAASLLQGKAPWTSETGEINRGYISKIDGSVQPYSVFVPNNYTSGRPGFNLSLWFHGRGENLSELNFIAGGKGFLPGMPEMKNTIMLYPYGRYCNAFKFAGEVDVLEAMAAVKKAYSINENGLIDRGFSMGGAAAWQFAVHYPDLWLAANPGAGFAETQEFMRVFGKETLEPTWFEQKLWHLYDCTDYASNLSNLPLVAYNGDNDAQKQAADIMEKAMKAEGLTLQRIIGPNTGHSYHKTSAATVDSILSMAAAKGKNPPPVVFHFTTYTLKFNKMYWLTVDGLKEHWAKARVDAKILGNVVELNTSNVSALSLDMKLISGLLNIGSTVRVRIDGQLVKIGPKLISGIASAKMVMNLHLTNGKWLAGKIPGSDPVKKHNLQGPIDDAFMSAFIVVRPTGNSKNKLFDDWSKSELDRFLVQWRRQFRGDAIVKDDKDITAAELSSNLILFGDAESNQVITKIQQKLPVQWDLKGIHLGGKLFPSADHALILIAPNPLNPTRYVVLNSGFTFREATFLNNSKQVPVLPDWAVIDLTSPPDAVYPGKIAAAGFFDEQWKLNHLP